MVASCLPTIHLIIIVPGVSKAGGVEANNVLLITGLFEVLALRSFIFSLQAES